MYVLKQGGRIFSFDDGTVGLDDVDGNTLKFYYPTFRWLLNKGFIEVAERPSIGCEIYCIASHFE